MSGSATGEMKAEPNLTPLLDVVFQLITFFMLVFKISGDNFDQHVRLPVAGSARPIEGRQALEDRIILNIDSKGRLLWEGKPLSFSQGVAKIGEQANLTKLNRKFSGQASADGTLPTTIILRADRAAEFGLVYRYITACQGHGFTKFALKAMNAES
jgi:biopolymer transport protein ExbD